MHRCLRSPPSAEPEPSTALSVLLDLMVKSILGAVASGTWCEVFCFRVPEKSIAAALEPTPLSMNALPTNITLLTSCLGVPRGRRLHLTT